jgi:L-alanine-DL-glutamate epimerase-like enolase superfamily enzyme
MLSIDSLDVRPFTIPTDGPESDGTACWEDTTLVLVSVRAGGIEGLGYSYAHPAAAAVVGHTLRPLVVGGDAFAVEAAWLRMAQALRNPGRPGIGSHALSAVDAALWDLKARLLGVSLLDLLGPARDAIPLYGSGGFTNWTNQRLTEQMADWAAEGFRMVKMKVGTYPGLDLARVRNVREAVGERAAIFVDANGRYSRKQALALAEGFAAEGVAWFEEPVSSDDLDGLRLVRDRAPAGMSIAAGEYGYTPDYFRRMLEAGAVDVLQADATRCGGVTGFLKAAALAEGFGLPLSAHTAPSLHVHLCCAVTPAVHLEWFHDHVRIEAMLFDGALSPVDGRLAPDRSRPGNGLALRAAEAARFAA